MLHLEDFLEVGVEAGEEYVTFPHLDVHVVVEQLLYHALKVEVLLLELLSRVFLQLADLLRQLIDGTR